MVIVNSDQLSRQIVIDCTYALRHFGFLFFGEIWEASFSDDKAER